MTLIEEAIQHYKYGITHDIFSEPVTSYARVSIMSLKKRMPKKVRYTERTADGHILGYCPSCILKVLDKSNYCYECGQALDWSE